MTDTPFAPPTRQAVAAVDRSLPNKVTGRLRTALLDMVWKASHRDDAALANRMTVHGLREALKRPHVMAFYNRELEVLRASERPRNIHRLCEIRDAGNNMPAVNAVKALELLDSEAKERPNAAIASPGVTIRIFNVMQSDAGKHISPQPPQHDDELETVQRFDPVFRVP